MCAMQPVDTHPRCCSRSSSVCAMLAGGSHSDPGHSKFTSSCHFYLWLFLLLPLHRALHLELKCDSGKKMSHVLFSKATEEGMKTINTKNSILILDHEKENTRSILEQK